MRILVTAALALCLITPAIAAETLEVRQVGPKFGTQFAKPSEVQGLNTLAPESTPVPADLPLNKAAVTLNCENDNVIDLGNTLVLAAGDLAGTIFAPPVTPNPFHIREVNVGLVDFGQSYPGTLRIEFYEDNLAGSYIFATAILVTIPAPGPGGGTIYNVDVSAFNIVMSNEALVLVSDDAPGAGYMLPTGDSSPRCFDGSNLCSVHVPIANPALFIYGVGEPTCAGTGIELLDLVLELVVDETVVSTTSSSVGAVKASYEE